MSNLQRSRRAAGFTLVELLIVISILLVLIAILLPSLHKAWQSAQQIQCASNQRQLVMAIFMYANDNQQCLPGPPVKMWGAGPSYAARNGYRAGSDTPPYDPTGLTNPDPDLAWGILDRLGYVTSALLLGCPGRTLPYMDATNTTSGPFKALETDNVSQYVHYSYRYNASAAFTYTLAESATYGTAYGQNFKSDLHSLTRRGFSKQAIVYEYPGAGLHFGGGVTSVEAQAMVANPNNWPHLTGGNVTWGDGSVTFVRNAKFGTGSASIGWPCASSSDQTYPETTGSASNPTVNSIPAFLDTQYNQ